LRGEGSAGGWSGWGRASADAVSDNRALFAILIPFAAAAVVVDALTGVPVAARLWGRPLLYVLWAGLQMGLLTAALSVGLFAVERLRILRAARGAGADPPPLREAWRTSRVRPTGPQVLRVAVALVVTALIFHVFLGFKGAIPLFQPFAWDEAFMRLDRALHLGRDPWVLIHPLVGYPIVTRMLDLVYYVWFPVNILVLMWFARMPEGPERRRFFVSYFLTWIVLGNVAATAFSSAGPCYYDLATGSLGPYAELMNYLHAVDAHSELLALRVQEMLLDAYSADAVNTVEGIAAMPSLHVALPFLFALGFREVNRGLSIAFVLFGVLILIGSVHLGWHYAVDGYAAIVGAAAI